MALTGLFPLLTDSHEFRSLAGSLHEAQANKTVIVPEGANAFAIGALWQEYGGPVFVLTPSPESARRLADQLVTWCGDSTPVFQFPETESIPFERYLPDLASTHQRLRTMAALVHSELTDRPPIVVASVAAATFRTLSRRSYDAVAHWIRVGERYDLADLIRGWTRAGYTVQPTVEIPGAVSRRGGIVDVFPVSRDAPVRIEFFDDEIESIREFDAESQRSTEILSEVLIPPALETLPHHADREVVESTAGKLTFDRTLPEPARRIPVELGQIFDDEWGGEISFYSGFFDHGAIFDYLPRETLLITMRPGAIEDASRSADNRLREQRRNKESRGDVPAKFPQPHMEWGQLADIINARPRRLSITPWGVDSDLPGGADSLPLGPAPVTSLGIERLLGVLQERHDASLRTVVLTNHAQRLSELSAERGLSVTVKGQLLDAVEPGDVAVIQGTVRQGFSVNTDDQRPLAIFTDTEIFGVAKERRRVRKRPVRKGPALEQLKPGSFVVHIEHGIGRFAGTRVMGDEGREYLVLEYAEEDKLYVPTEHLDRIQLYHGPSDSPPRLTRLGTQEWSRARSRAKRATEQLAGELIALYAAREVTEGFASVADTPWQDSLEASFPYEETPDQLTTLAQVKKDLESTRPMDRLICGDVGYGKTEIALRAAFKVAQSGRQVAILVPTTVLAQQHYDTFTERLKPFPVTVEMLSRFRSPAEQQKVVGKLASGEVDIVIGTHRLLQRDVRFKNIGLAIVDEEHKFGVSHKERLKQLRTQVDVMTLSATPIPRTLQMSLAGIRDMSTIETPPEERLAIKTYVTEESDELVREAILREVDRGGQVFYLHNRVKDIDLVAARLMKLVPEATFEVGHGQMADDGLERVMAAFERRDFDVLICTTIIESGIDMPNVNTLIIDRADMFGLSQLYQLRGRIGRGPNRAYAYLMVPRGKALTETADARLNTILAATELGAGFQIALRDLEIRGMGNILGGEQSGHIAAIGFDLYTKLLSDTVTEMKEGGGRADGDRPRILDFSTVRVDLGVDARIPDSYIEDLAQRLSIYQRLARIHAVDELGDLREEMRDRYGPVPRNVDLLLQAEKIRVLAEKAGVDGVTTTESRATLALSEPTGGARAPLQKMLGRGVSVGHLKIRVDIDREELDWVEELTAVVEQILIFRDRMMAVVLSAAEPVSAGAGD